MKALGYYGPGKRALENKAKPAVKEPTDTVIKITHHFVLNDIMKVYDTFENAIKEKALKVILTN